MEKIIVKNKPFSNVFYGTLGLLISLLFLWFGITGLDLDNIDAGQVIIWLAAFAFIGMAIFFIWRALDSSPTIIFDDEGISSKYFYAEKIYWNEIAEVQAVENDTIILKLNNENKYMTEIQSSKILKKLPHLAFNLSFVGANMSVNEALEIINQKIPLELKQ